MPTTLVIRPLSAGEEQLFLSMPTAGVGNRGSYDPEIYSPERTWVALRGNDVVARAAWAAVPGTDVPVGVDWFDVTPDSVDAGVALLREAHRTLRDRYDRVPQYHIILEPGWRDRPDEAAQVELRLAAAQSAGLRPAGERVRTVWTDPGPQPAARTTIVPASPEAVVALGLPTAVLTGVEPAFVDGVDLRHNPLYALESARAYVATDGSGGAVVGLGLHRDTPVIGYLAAASDETLRDLLATVAAPGLIADTESYSPLYEEAGYRPTRCRLYLTP